MFLINVLFVSSMVVIANAANLPPCTKSQRSSNLNECISSKIEAAKPYLADGIPELSIPSLRSIVIPYSFIHKSNIDFGVWNFNVSGLENFNVLKVDADYKNNVFKFQFEFPYAEGNGGYECKGNLFNLKFDGTGPVKIQATNFVLHFELKTKLVKRDGQTYFEQVYRKIYVTIDGTYHLYLHKLYLGNAEITKIMNGILNDNSYYMYNLLVPILEKRLDDILDKAVDKIFEIYTYDELLP